MIAFPSPRKTVVVTETGLLISYYLKKNKTLIKFSDVGEFKTRRSERETVKYPARIYADFTIILKNGRRFTFDRSEFVEYEILRTTVYHLLEKRNQQ